MVFETTGDTLQRELFGQVDIERIKSFPEYQKFNEAMETARRLQPGDPKDPSPDFAYEVLVQLEVLLDAKDKVGFYTAIGTILDAKHGIDGWFELDDGTRATVDLTRNVHKGYHKADIVFPVPQDGLDRTVDEKQFLGYAQALAERIVQIMKSGERVAYRAS